MPFVLSLLAVEKVTTGRRTGWQLSRSPTGAVERTARAAPVTPRRAGAFARICSTLCRSRILSVRKIGGPCRCIGPCLPPNDHLYPPRTRHASRYLPTYLAHTKPGRLPRHPRVRLRPRYPFVVDSLADVAVAYLSDGFFGAGKRRPETYYRAEVYNCLYNIVERPPGAVKSPTGTTATDVSVHAPTTLADHRH